MLPHVHAEDDNCEASSKNAVSFEAGPSVNFDLSVTLAAARNAREMDNIDDFASVFIMEYLNASEEL